MDSNETFLSERYGRENHFRVPEGYFDGLPARIMAGLPDNVPTMTVVGTRHRRLRLWLGVAACLCGVVFGAAVCFTSLADGKDKSAATVASTSTVASTQQSSAASYVEEVADYTMMDNTDIYAYLCNE